MAHVLFVVSTCRQEQSPLLLKGLQMALHSVKGSDGQLELLGQQMCTSRSCAIERMIFE